MRIFILGFLILTSYLFPQIKDDWSFFPAHIGDIWEYQVYAYQGTYSRKLELLADSLTKDNYRYLLYKKDTLNNTVPVYYLDSSSFSVHLAFSSYPHPHFRKYKVDAVAGETWIFETDTYDRWDTVYQMALCRAKYTYHIYGAERTVMEITYFRGQPDTVVNENSWPLYTSYLATGIGEYYYFDEDGAGPQYLLTGCRINGDTIGILTAAEKEVVLKRNFNLSQNYPNPFNPSTIIEYEVMEPGNILIKIYDILGREVAILVNEYKNSGHHSIKFNGSNLASGIYIYELKSGTYIQRKKMNLVK